MLPLHPEPSSVCRPLQPCQARFVAVKPARQQRTLSVLLAFAKPEEGFAEMPVYAGAAVAANRRVAAKRRQAQQAKRDSFNFVQETLKRFDVSKSGARRRIACSSPARRRSCRGATRGTRPAAARSSQLYCTRIAGAPCCARWVGRSVRRKAAPKTACSTSRPRHRARARDTHTHAPAHTLDCACLCRRRAHVR